jgi:ABC-2 type transport system permease protein
MEPRGEVYDIGYRSYDGPREGRARARKTLWVNGMRTALGLGRGWTSKALPVLLFISMLTPALVFTLIASIAGPLAAGIPSHEDYYEIASTILLIFSAIIAPELLTADRRSGVINLYLVRPLSPTDYVLGRWLAFFSITLVLVYLPQVVLFIGLTLAAPELPEYLRDNWLDIPRFLGAGLVVAAFTTTIPLSIAAFTSRRAYAAAFVIGLVIIATATSNVLVEEAGGAEAVSAGWFALIDIRSVPIFINDVIFNKTSNSEVLEAMRILPPVVVYGWYLLLTAGAGSLLWWRYQNLRV